MELGKDVLKLLEKTLIRNSKDRPTAIELLNKPIIIEGISTVCVAILNMQSIIFTLID